MTPAPLPAYLFAWNPVKYAWPGIGDCMTALQRGETVQEDWSCATKRAKPGDRAFITLVGCEPRGIFASGYIASELFLGKSHRGKMANRVMIRFDHLLDPSREATLGLDLLNIGALGSQLWTPQASGIAIRPELCAELEALWEDFLLHRPA